MQKKISFILLFIVILVIGYESFGSFPWLKVPFTKNVPGTFSPRQTELSMLNTDLSASGLSDAPERNRFLDGFLVGLPASGLPKRMVEMCEMDYQAMLMGFPDPGKPTSSRCLNEDESIMIRNELLAKARSAKDSGNINEFAMFLGVAIRLARGESYTSVVYDFILNLAEELRLKDEGQDFLWKGTIDGIVDEGVTLQAEIDQISSDSTFAKIRMDQALANFIDVFAMDEEQYRSKNCGLVSQVSTQRKSYSYRIKRNGKWSELRSLNSKELQRIDHENHIARLGNPDTAELYSKYIGLVNNVVRLPEGDLISDIVNAVEAHAALIRDFSESFGNKVTYRNARWVARAAGGVGVALELTTSDDIACTEALCTKSAKQVHESIVSNEQPENIEINLKKATGAEDVEVVDNEQLQSQDDFGKWLEEQDKKVSCDKEDLSCHELPPEEQEEAKNMPLSCMYLFERYVEMIKDGYEFMNPEDVTDNGDESSALPYTDCNGNPSSYPMDCLEPDQSEPNPPVVENERPGYKPGDPKYTQEHEEKKKALGEFFDGSKTGSDESSDRIGSESEDGQIIRSR